MRSYLLTTIAFMLSGCAVSHAPLMKLPSPEPKRVAIKAEALGVAEKDVAEARRAALDAKVHQAQATVAAEADVKKQTALRSILRAKFPAGLSEKSPKIVKAYASDPKLQLADAAVVQSQAAKLYAEKIVVLTSEELNRTESRAKAARSEAAEGVTLGDILDEAVRLRTIYEVRYEQAGKIADVSQLPIIGAAAFAAGIALDNSKHATSILGYTGIAVGAYTTTRSAIFPPDLPQLYLGGWSAMSCVVNQGMLFTSSAARERYQAFEDAIAPVNDATMTLKGLLAEVPADERAALAGQIELAGLTITQASQAYDAALKQVAADRSKEAAFQNVIAQIAESVAKKVKVRPAIDFATLRDSFYKAPAATPTDATKQESDEADHGAVLQAAIADLSRRAARLVQLTPDYVAALAIVEKCPDRLE